jgi:hypothetical protein
VGRRREDAAPQNRQAAARLNEEVLPLETNPIPDAQPAVEVQKVDAAPQQNMLAVVDDFAGLVPGNRP